MAKDFLKAIIAYTTNFNIIKILALPIILTLFTIPTLLTQLTLHLKSKITYNTNNALILLPQILHYNHNITIENCCFCIPWQRGKGEQVRYLYQPIIFPIRPSSSTSCQFFRCQSHCFPWPRWTGLFAFHSHRPKHSTPLSTWNWGARCDLLRQRWESNESARKQRKRIFFQENARTIKVIHQRVFETCHEFSLPIDIAKMANLTLLMPNHLPYFFG